MVERKRVEIGRPPKYTEQFCLGEIKYFWNLLQDDMGTNKSIIAWQDMLRDKPYSRQRISEWRKKFAENEEFSDTIKKIDEELEHRLLRIGLSKSSSTAMAIFALKNNYGWKDKQEVEHSGTVTTRKVFKVGDKEIEFE